jgi:hypothetical protein
MNAAPCKLTLEEWGGRICGSDYMFGHALDLIPEDLPP